MKVALSAAKTAVEITRRFPAKDPRTFETNAGNSLPSVGDVIKPETSVTSLEPLPPEAQRLLDVKRFNNILLNRVMAGQELSLQQCAAVNLGKTAHIKVVPGWNLFATAAIKSLKELLACRVDDDNDDSDNDSDDGDDSDDSDDGDGDSDGDSDSDDDDGDSDDDGDRNDGDGDGTTTDTCLSVNNEVDNDSVTNLRFSQLETTDSIENVSTKSPLNRKRQRTSTITPPVTISDIFGDNSDDDSIDVMKHNCVNDDDYSIADIVSENESTNDEDDDDNSENDEEFGREIMNYFDRGLEDDLPESSTSGMGTLSVVDIGFGKKKTVSQADDYRFSNLSNIISLYEFCGIVSKRPMNASEKKEIGIGLCTEEYLNSISSDNQIGIQIARNAIQMNKMNIDQMVIEDDSDVPSTKAHRGRVKNSTMVFDDSHPERWTHILWIKSKYNLPVINGSVPRLPHTLKKGSSQAKHYASSFFLTLFKPWAKIKGKNGLSWNKFELFIRQCAAPTATYRQRAILQTILRMLNGMRISSKKKKLLNKWRVRGVVPWNLLEAQDKMRAYERNECRRKGMIGIPDECAYRKISHDEYNHSNSFYENIENADDGEEFLTLTRDLLFTTIASHIDGTEEDKTRRDQQKMDKQTAYTMDTIDKMLNIYKDVITGLKDTGKHSIITNSEEVQKAHEDLNRIFLLTESQVKDNYDIMKIELATVDDVLRPIEIESLTHVPGHTSVCICEEGDEPADNSDWIRDTEVWPVLNKEQEAIATEIYQHARSKLNHSLHPHRHKLPPQKLIMIKGGPGTGKTTLMKEVQRRVSVYASRINHPQV